MVSSKTLYRLSHVTCDVSVTPFAVWPNTTRYGSNPLALVWVKGYIPVLWLVQANKSQMLLFGLDVRKGFEPVNTPVPAPQPLNQNAMANRWVFFQIAANKKTVMECDYYAHWQNFLEPALESGNLNSDQCIDVYVRSCLEPQTVACSCPNRVVFTWNWEIELWVDRKSRASRLNNGKKASG
mgnify:CR=1 FL=1